MNQIFNFDQKKKFKNKLYRALDNNQLFGPIPSQLPSMQSLETL